MKRTTLTNLLLLLVSCVIVLGGAEAFLRVRAERARAAIRATFNESKLCTMASVDKRLIYTYKPNECGNNSQGYRDVEHSFEKPAGTIRIVLIGDSVAEGRDVAPDSAFGRVLERILNERNDGQHYEVILLARAGYSTSQELVLLEVEAPRYDPDWVLWSYCMNDPANPVYHNANGALGAYYYHPRSQVAALVKAGMFRVKQKIRGRGCPTEFHAFIHCANWDEIEKNMGRMRHIRANKAFVLHPIFEDEASFKSYSLKRYHERLLAMALLDAGMLPVDLLDAFSSYDPHQLKINRPDYFDPWHMNELGHRLTAEYIAKTVFLPEGSPQM
jgi:lysophospholipase L1-like esterase